MADLWPSAIEAANLHQPAGKHQGWRTQPHSPQASVMSILLVLPKANPKGSSLMKFTSSLQDSGCGGEGWGVHLKDKPREVQHTGLPLKLCEDIVLLL